MSNHYRRIISLFGVPGSGKGTQGAILAKKLSLQHISTGDLLRKAQNDESHIYYDIINESLDKGILVSDKIINSLIQTEISVNGSGLILDGYPRSISQARYLEGIIVDCNFIAIFFDLNDDIAVNRLVNRFMCKVCNKIYNHTTQKPSIDGICDHCGSDEFITRSDDNKDVIENRINEYRKSTLPLLDFYKQKSALFVINADNSTEYVANDVDLLLKTV